MASRSIRHRRRDERGTHVSLRPHVNPRRVAALAVIAAVSAPIWGAPSPASAHAGLESSTPSPSAVLESSPRDIVLDFTEPVSLVDDSIGLFDADLNQVETGEPQILVANRVEVRDLPTLDDGLYLVSWRVQSQDGHLSEGAFTFQVGTASSATTASALLAAISSSDEGPYGLGVARHVSRAVVYLGTAAALGTLACAAVIGLRRIRRVVTIGLVVASLGSVVQLAFQGVYVSGGSWADVVDVRSWNEVLSTRLGIGLVVRIALFAVLAVLLIAARDISRAAKQQESSSETATASSTWWRSTTALVGIGIVATFSLTGHPSASSPAGLAVAVDAVHLGAALFWVGGLFGIFFGERDDQVVRAFSRMATFLVPVTVVTGSWQVWHLFDIGEDATRNEWGRALVIKVSLVLAVVTVASVARWLVRSDHLAPVRRLVGVEIVSALAIIAATAVMVSAPPSIRAEPSPISATVAQDDIIVNVTVTPGSVGANEIHVTILPPGGSLAPVDSLAIRLTEADSDIPPIAAEVELLGPNHFVGTVSILRSGVWELELLVNVTPSRVVRLATSIEI